MSKKKVALNLLDGLVQDGTAIVEVNPWLIPTTVAVATLPVAVWIASRAKTRNLKKQLQIEREKTKQLMLQQGGGPHHGHHHGHAFPKKLAE